MRKKLPTRRSNRTSIPPKNPPSSKQPQSHTHIHIHSHSSSSPSSHSSKSIARKVIYPKGSTPRKEAASSQKKGSKGNETMHEDDDSPSPPPHHSPPPRRSTPHPSGCSAPSQRLRRSTLHNTKEPPNLDSLDFKNKFGKSHSHYDPHRFISCAAYEFHSQVLGELYSYIKNTHLTLSHEPISAALGYEDEGARAFMHMWDCVRSDKKCILSYGMFLTCVFEYFNIDLSNESVENRISMIKCGGVPESAKEKRAKGSKASVFSESEDESLLSAETSDKHRFSEMVKDVVT
ncbi:uncharacterized protein DS421_14g460240 [Arachis hypogaea]|nr:uncharacterized protein DS421_14g460240 [Arachis hypogaea]